MKNKEKIMRFLNKNSGYIATSDFIEMGISKSSIPLFLKDGLIRKVSHGLYIGNSLFEDEYYIIQKKYPYAIFSYNTAFHILNLTNRAPFAIDVTIPNNKKIRGNYDVHYVTPRVYEIGIMEVESPYGNIVKVYNAERSICDMLKNGNFDLELQNRILDYYFKSKDKDIDKLLEYSKIFNIYEKVNTIVEVMMKW